MDFIKMHLDSNHQEELVHLSPLAAARFYQSEAQSSMIKRITAHYETYNSVT